MKASKTLFFLLGVFAMMGLLWLVVPAEGVMIDPLVIRFPSYQGAKEDASRPKVNVDSVLNTVDERFCIEDEDTLQFYRKFFYENPDRIQLPKDNYLYFDVLFRKMEQAKPSGQLLRIVHYGDSQLEGDRITGPLRAALQKRFGGSGAGMFPAMNRVPSAAIDRTAVGDFTHYTMYGDSTTRRAGHNRYGVMAQVVQVAGSGTVTVKGRTTRSTRESVKRFSSITVLYGKPSDRFSVKVSSDSLHPTPTVKTSQGGVTFARWDFGRSVAKATLKFSGSAEIYGISADGGAGVTVDNVPLRGCSGTIFTRISADLLRESYNLDDTQFIILQFGGNYMPMLRSTKVIESYQQKIEAQIKFFRRLAPQAPILFIGPSDMGKSVNGRVVTWPRLPELVDSLRATVLRNNAAYFDLYRMMGGENSMVQWVKHQPAYAGPDYIHFTPAGAQHVGDVLSQSLLTYYDFYRLRKRVPKARVKKVMHP